MKKNLLLIAAIVFTVIISTGFVYSELQSSPPGKKAKKEKAEKPYRIKEQRNISRVQIRNSNAIENQIEITFNKSSNMNTPENIRLVESSGNAESSMSFIGFKNVEFPFTGTIHYTVKPRFAKSTTMGSKSGNQTNFENNTDLQCKLTFTINEPGAWEVKIAN